MRYQVEQLGYFGLKGMGLFSHLLSKSNKGW
jgi:hypothetical protein